MSHAGGIAALVARSSSPGAAAGAPLVPLARACAAALPVNVPMRRTSPAGWRQRPRGLEWHEGLDLVAAVGDPVYAVRPGVVMFATEDGARGFGGYGRTVVIDHGPSGEAGAAVGLDPLRPVFGCYAHNSHLTVRRGQIVAAGALIAHSGRSSGGAWPTMPPHVHLGTRYMRRPTDPLFSLYGATPWPGTYPHPLRAPRELANAWVDPERWLAAWGIIAASDTRASSYIVLAGSAADCARVPGALVRQVAPELRYQEISPELRDLAAPYPSGPVESSSSSGSESPAAAVAIGIGIAAAGVAVIATRKGGSR